MPRVVVDLRPLRESPPFRRLWGSSLVAGLAGQMGVFAVALQVFTITGSSVAVGAIGVFVAGPMIGFGMFGGTLADIVDRRTLIIVVTAGQTILALGFWLQAAAGWNRLWVIYLLVAVQSTFASVAVPTRRAFVGRLLPGPSIPAAMTLHLFAMTAGGVLGPVLGGLLTAASGLQWCYAVQALAGGVALVAVVGLPAMPPIRSPVSSSPVSSSPGPTSPVEATPRLGWGAVQEALEFVRRKPVLRGTFLADLSLTVLGTPAALFPAINAERFGGAPQTLGLFGTATAVGALLGTTLSGGLGRIVRQGRALLIAVAVWGVTIVGFGLAWNLQLALGLLALGAAVDMVAVGLGQTLVQTSTPDELRGRVSAAEQIVQMGGPQVGGLRAGLVGTWLGPAAGVVAGGVATVVAIGVVAARVPALRHQRRDDPDEPTEAPAAPGTAA